MILHPLNLVDFFLQFGFSKSLMCAFGALGISLLVQFLIWGGVDEP